MHIFTGDFNFKGLTAQRLYKLFGVKGLTTAEICKGQNKDTYIIINIYVTGKPK
jgi:hypothetical protein